jgi:hypothetical protein
MDSTENRSPEEGQAPPPEDAWTHLKGFFGALLLLAISVGFAVAALRIPFQTSNWVWYTSPGIFALAMAICLGTSSAFLAYREIRRWSKKRHKAESIGLGERLRLWGMGRFLAASAIILGYILLLGKAPFLVLSAGLVLVLGTLFREGRFKDALRPSVIAALVVVAVAVVISRIFGILFP